MPKALIVAYYFPPIGGGGTQRTLKFTRYLPDFGWEPYVLTVKNRKHVVSDESLLQQLPPSVPVHTSRAILPAQMLRGILGHNPQQQKSGSRDGLFTRAKKTAYTLGFIPDEHIGWQPFAIRAGARLIRREKINVIFSTGPPNTCHLIGKTLKRRTGLPWIADLRDLWDMYPESYNPYNWQWRKRLDDKMERDTLLEADRIIVVSNEMRRHLLEKIPELRPARVHVLTNGFDPDDFQNVQPIHNEKHFTIVHSGTLFPWRRLRPMLAAMHKLFQIYPRFEDVLRLKLLGVVPSQDRLDVNTTGLAKCVEIMDYCSYQESLAHLTGADALLLLVGNIPHARKMIPGKLFDYIGSRRPILAVGPYGDTRKLVREQNMGYDFHPGETERIAAVLAAWVRQRQNGGIQFQPNQSSQFHRRRLTQRLAEIMREICS